MNFLLLRMSDMMKELVKGILVSSGGIVVKNILEVEMMMMMFKVLYI